MFQQQNSIFLFEFEHNPRPRDKSELHFKWRASLEASGAQKKFDKQWLAKFSDNIFCQPRSFVCRRRKFSHDPKEAPDGKVPPQVGDLGDHRRGGGGVVSSLWPNLDSVASCQPNLALQSKNAHLLENTLASWSFNWVALRDGLLKIQCWNFESGCIAFKVLRQPRTLWLKHLYCQMVHLSFVRKNHQRVFWPLSWLVK